MHHKIVRQKMIFSFAAIIITALFPVCPCLAAPPATPSAMADAAATDGREDKRGDSIIMGTIGEASNLLPRMSTDASSSEVSQHLFISLIKYDENLKIVPWAAESYEVLDGGLRLRFTLKPGILWEDGVEMTAEDIEFTYKTMINPETPTAYAGDFLMVDTFTLTGKYSFEVTYTSPYARSLETWMGSILPKHVLEREDFRETAYARAPVGSGPYKFKEWVAGSRIALEANPLYFKGRPNIDRMVFTTIPDLTTMFLELKAGALDMMSLTPQQYTYQAKDPSVAGHYNQFRYLSFAYTYLGYNLESPLFKDARVRRAIAHAVDKKEIIAGALLGQGEATIGPYIPGTWAYNAAIQDYPTDIAAAEKLLAEAGWRKDEAGVLRNSKGLPFAFTIMTNQGNEQRIKTAVIIQSQLKKLGMSVSIRTVEWATFFSQFVNKGFFDAVILGWTTPLDPDLYDVWHSSRLRPSGLNFMKYANKKVDALIERGRKTFDRAERKAVYDEVQVYLHEDQPYCFLYVPYALPVVSKRFRGIRQAPAGITYNMDDWWVPKAEQKYKVTP
ncbi:Extracellular solute-binding protein family 5 [uncultured delta proteobacterium]|uniref:Extracellular solute-binding protein family 5 n=1 Tax=uncultured delta proteobacterium TaxID=34034 RepID=A0A212J0A1_9DELT|nr:Extracellular solute-binding protein family 5 [uncultured delta proteobacterium]